LARFVPVLNAEPSHFITRWKFSRDPQDGHLTGVELEPFHDYNASKFPSLRWVIRSVIGRRRIGNLEYAGFVYQM
jgi:hypothetical protein